MYVIIFLFYLDIKLSLFSLVPGVNYHPDTFAEEYNTETYNDKRHSDKQGQQGRTENVDGETSESIEPSDSEKLQIEPIFKPLDDEIEKIEPVDGAEEIIDPVVGVTDGIKLTETGRINPVDDEAGIIEPSDVKKVITEPTDDTEETIAPLDDIKETEDDEKEDIEAENDETAGLEPDKLRTRFPLARPTPQILEVEKERINIIPPPEFYLDETLDNVDENLPLAKIIEDDESNHSIIYLKPEEENTEFDLISNFDDEADDILQVPDTFTPPAKEDGDNDADNDDTEAEKEDDVEELKLVEAIVVEPLQISIEKIRSQMQDDLTEETDEYIAEVEEEDAFLIGKANLKASARSVEGGKNSKSEEQEDESELSKINYTVTKDALIIVPIPVDINEDQVPDAIIASDDLKPNLSIEPPEIFEISNNSAVNQNGKTAEFFTSGNTDFVDLLNTSSDQEIIPSEDGRKQSSRSDGTLNFATNNQFKVSRTKSGDLSPLISFLKNHKQTPEINPKTPDDLKTDRSAFKRRILPKSPIYVKQTVIPANSDGKPSDQFPFPTGEVFNSEIGKLVPTLDSKPGRSSKPSINPAGYSFNGFNFQDRSVFKFIF